MITMRFRALFWGTFLAGGILYGAQECRYIVQWAPSVTQNQAQKTLASYRMTLETTYRMLSKEQGTLIQLVRGSCDPELPRRLRREPLIQRVENDKIKQLAQNPKGAAGGITLWPLALGGLLPALLTLYRKDNDRSKSS